MIKLLLLDIVVFIFVSIGIFGVLVALLTMPAIDVLLFITGSLAVILLDA